MEKLLEKQSKRDHLLFVFGINCGLRISDILRLNVGDVRNKTHIQIIEKKTGKFKKFPINAKLQPLLLKANLEQTLSDASLLAQAIPLHIKSENYLHRKDKVIELTEDSCKSHVGQLLEQIDNLRNKNFVVGKDLLMDYLKTFENVADHYYSINGKTDTIKIWFEENVLPLDKV